MPSRPYQTFKARQLALQRCNLAPLRSGCHTSLLLSVCRQKQVKEMNMLHVPFDRLPKFNSLYIGKQPSKQNQAAASQ